MWSGRETRGKTPSREARRTNRSRTHLRTLAEPLTTRRKAASCGSRLFSPSARSAEFPSPCSPFPGFAGDSGGSGTSFYSQYGRIEVLNQALDNVLRNGDLLPKTHSLRIGYVTIEFRLYISNTPRQTSNQGLKGIQLFSTPYPNSRNQRYAVTVTHNSQSHLKWQ